MAEDVDKTNEPDEAQETNKPGAPEEPSVVTYDEITMEMGAIDLEKKDGVISGNVYRGGVLRGLANLAIEGEIAGVPDSRSIIEVGGDVQVEQSVTGAKIVGRNIVVSGDISDSQIWAEGYLEVHGDLTNTQINVGSRASLIKMLNLKRHEARTVEQKISELNVQTGSAARKFVRDYPQVDLKMGNILVPQKRELRVRLQQFYSAVGTPDVAKIDKALEEFYLRVVVGMLTRNNKAYISRNPSRHKIFLKLIEELRIHILKIRSLDKYQGQKTILLQESDALLKQLKNPEEEPFIRIGGCASKGLSVTMVRLKGFQEASGGAIDIERAMIEGRFVKDEDGEEDLWEVTSPNGVKMTSKPPENGFSNGSFTAWEDDLIWKPAKG